MADLGLNYSIVFSLNCGRINKKNGRTVFKVLPLSTIVCFIKECLFVFSSEYREMYVSFWVCFKVYNQTINTAQCAV